MEKADQSIQREVVLRRDHNPGLIESLERTLAMKFRRVKQDEGCVLGRVAKRMEQPRRNSLARGDVFRCEIIHRCQPRCQFARYTSSTC